MLAQTHACNHSQPMYTNTHIHISPASSIGLGFSVWHCSVCLLAKHSRVNPARLPFPFQPCVQPSVRLSLHPFEVFFSLLHPFRWQIIMRNGEDIWKVNYFHNRKAFHWQYFFFEGGFNRWRFKQDCILMLSLFWGDSIHGWTTTVRPEAREETHVGNNMMSVWRVEQHSFCGRYLTSI
jgi:hypothetical protein